MSANNNRNDASSRAYIGASGSGKGWSIREHLKAQSPVRFVAFDPMQEYAGPGVVVVTKPLALMRELTKPAFRISYQPANLGERKALEAEFGKLCLACFEAGNLTLLVEELELVTTASWAPPPWRMITKRGRHRGLKIIGASQSPADVDKHFFGGCTYIRCFTLREPPHRKRMADALAVPQATIDGLKTITKPARTEITYYEKDFSAGTEGLQTVVLKR